MNTPSISTSPPVVSVLMAAYNAERTLRSAVLSVFRQTFRDWELVVLDDASTDKTPDILAELSATEPRMRVVRNDHNLRFSGTRNRLLELADKRTEFLAVLDSDDIAYPARLEKQVAFLREHPELVAAGCCLRILDAEGAEVGSRSYPLEAKDVRNRALCSNPVAHSSLMMRKKVAETIGNYDATLSCCEDYDYILRLLDCGEVANLPEELVGYRVSDGQHTARHVKQMLSCTLAVQRRYLFRKKHFRWMPFLGFLGKHLLFLLPSGMILWLFRRMTVIRKEAKP